MPAPQSPKQPALVFVSLTLSFLLGCNSAQEDAPPYAYVAPASVNLRAQFNQKNSTVAVLKHGERVIVVDARRRNIKIRSAAGVEGWVDSLDLLSPEDKKRIDREREFNLRLPSEGVATPYEVLNIHLDPDRKSPAFAQVAEGTPLSVLAHKIRPKLSDAPRTSFAFERPRPPSRKARKDRAAKANTKQPPKPPPPKPPQNWEHVWSAPAEEEAANDVSEDIPRKSAQTRKAPVMEDWTLVRTKSDLVGWVLTHNLAMSIPDDVAQYAGGRHITSYFDLGAVNDERDGLKHNWLWTTASGALTSDFDSWRVFLWNRRRHRYETSYRQRDLEGHFPVTVDPPDPTYSARTFKLITREDDGKLHRRSYSFDGTRVHLTGTENYPPGGSDNRESSANNLQAGKSQSNWFQRQWLWWKARLRRTN